MLSNSITVFEHSTLYIGEQGFTKSHFDVLVKFNDLHGSKYFIPGLNKIKFKSYVGVIQAGKKAIEILPKADNNQSDNDPAVIAKWQSALLYMLKRAGYIHLNETQEASQGLYKSNLLEIYIFTFLKEVEKLIHQGLVKKYRKSRQNQTALKGRLLIEKQIQFNSIHKERFFTEHTVYDNNNQFNSILKTALEIIQFTSTNYTIKQEAAKQLLSFENIDSWRGTAKDFDKLILDRKTLPYSYAIRIARMIILNYTPDLTSGRTPIIAILFNMNVLFEKFIFRMLRRQEPDFSQYNLQVCSQSSSPFWNTKSIRPDIVIEFSKDQNGTVIKHRVIVDTKWKIINAGDPSDDDLKQMYTYNFQFGSTRSILFYPSIGQLNSGVVNYENSLVFTEHTHGCELYFSDLFENGEIGNSYFGRRFFNHLLGQTKGG